MPQITYSRLLIIRVTHPDQDITAAVEEALRRAFKARLPDWKKHCSLSFGGAQLPGLVDLQIELIGLGHEDFPITTEVRRS
jgi:hypothetical protein